MATNRKQDIAYIAIDTNVLVGLAVYEKYGEDIRKILESNHFKVDGLEEKIKSNHRLRHEFYNGYSHCIADSLEYIAQLYYNLRKGKIKIYITKTVLGEVGLAPKTLFKGKTAGLLRKKEIEVKELLENPYNDITVLTVNEKDSAQFALDKLRLSIEYVEVGAMDTVYNSEKEDYYPSKDAEIVAEASLFGLYLVTLNEKHFLHIDSNANDGKGDFERSIKIEEVNFNYGLKFLTSRMPHTDPPRPISLSSFVTRHKLRFKERKLYCTYPHINEETNEIEYNPLTL